MPTKLTKKQVEITNAADGWPTLAEETKVENKSQYEAAAELLKGIKALQKEANTVFDPAIKKAHEAHKAINLAKKIVTQPLKDAETTLKKKMNTWADEQDRLAKVEERRLQEEARQRAAEDRKREVEAMESVDPVVAREIERAPVAAPTVVVESEVPKVPGVSRAKKWKARCVDSIALFAYVYENIVERPDLMKYVSINEKALNAEATATKGAIEIPGVEFYDESSMRSS